MASSDNPGSNYPEVRADLTAVQSFIHGHPEVLHAEQPPDLRKDTASPTLPRISITGELAFNRTVTEDCLAGHDCRNSVNGGYLIHDEYDHKTGAHLFTDTYATPSPPDAPAFMDLFYRTHTAYNPDGSIVAVTAEAERPDQLSDIVRVDKDKNKGELQHFYLDPNSYSYTSVLRDSGNGPVSLRAVNDYVVNGRFTYTAHTYNLRDKNHSNSISVGANVGDKVTLKDAFYEHDGVNTTVYFDGVTHKPSVIVEEGVNDLVGHAYTVGPDGKLTPKSWLAGFIDDVKDR